MAKLMPQEIEVWYLVPALRRELAKNLVNEYNFSQKEVAKIFGLTPAAVSQYLNSKRGGDMKFSKIEKQKILEVAEKISKNRDNATKDIYDLCVLLRKSKILCKLHKKHDDTVSRDCSICGNFN
jgi:uncharacterized protein